MLFLSYIDPAQRALAFSVIDAQTSQVWSPAAKTFVPSDKASGDSLVPMTRLLGANWSTVLIGALPDFPDPPSPGQYLVYVHLATGGPPIEAPIEVTPSRPAAARMTLAVSVTR